MNGEFDWLFYTSYYEDLRHIRTKEQAYKHYKNHGINENRMGKNKENIIIDKSFYKFLYNDLSNKKNDIDLYRHYYKFGKKENRTTSREDIRYKLFDWKYYIIYNNLNIVNKENAYKHYIENKDKPHIVINKFQNFNYKYYKKYYNLPKEYTKNDVLVNYLSNKKMFINKYIRSEYLYFDPEKYKIYYNLTNLKSKKDIFQHYLDNYKKGYIYFNNNIKNNNITNEMAIAVSVYIDEKTPIEKVICSKIGLNSIINKCNNMYIIIVIDNCITIDYLEFLFDLIDNRPNVKVYMNKMNYGIAKTKNICIKLLEELNVNYYCLLDDDIEIKKNFYNYIMKIYKNIPDIPILAPFNIDMSYTKFEYNNIKLIKTNHYFGNLIVINKNSLREYGYMRKFEYKWGIEHSDLTYRYLKHTQYKDFAININKYINNFQVINGISTLHLHSCEVDHEKVKLNTEIYNKYNGIKEYVDYIFDKSEIKEITVNELNRIKYIEKITNKYKNIINNMKIYKNYINTEYLTNNNSFMPILYNMIQKDYTKYNNKYNKLTHIINKLNNTYNNINDNDINDNDINDSEFDNELDNNTLNIIKTDSTSSLTSLYDNSNQGYSIDYIV